MQNNYDTMSILGSSQGKLSETGIGSQLQQPEKQPCELLHFTVCT